MRTVTCLAEQGLVPLGTGGGEAFWNLGSEAEREAVVILGSPHSPNKPAQEVKGGQGSAKFLLQVCFLPSTMFLQAHVTTGSGPPPQWAGLGEQSGEIVGTRGHLRNVRWFELLPRFPLRDELKALGRRWLPRQVPS